MRPWLIWLFPLAFIIHDGEEVLTAAGWVNHHQALLAKIAAVNPVVDRVVSGLPATTAVMAGAVGLLLVIILAVTFALALWLRKPSGPRGALYVYAGLLAAFGIHVVSHIGWSIALGMYTPGVISAALVVPPVSGYLYWKLLRETPLGNTAALLSALAGVLLIVPALLIAHRFGHWIFG